MFEKMHETRMNTTSIIMPFEETSFNKVFGRIEYIERCVSRLLETMEGMSEILSDDVPYYVTYNHELLEDERAVKLTIQWYGPEWQAWIMDDYVNKIVKQLEHSTTM